MRQQSYITLPSSADLSVVPSVSFILQHIIIIYIILLTVTIIDLLNGIQISLNFYNVNPLYNTNIELQLKLYTLLCQ